MKARSLIVTALLALSITGLAAAQNNVRGVDGRSVPVSKEDEPRSRAQASDPIHTLPENLILVKKTKQFLGNLEGGGNAALENDVNNWRTQHRGKIYELKVERTQGTHNMGGREVGVVVVHIDYVTAVDKGK